MGYIDRELLVELAVKVLDLRLHWHDAAHLHTRSSRLPHRLPHPLPAIHVDLPGKFTYLTCNCR